MTPVNISATDAVDQYVDFYPRWTPFYQADAHSDGSMVLAARLIETCRFSDRLFAAF